MNTTNIKRPYDIRGRCEWRTGTYWIADNLQVMRRMPEHSVDLIYLDPPFNSGRNYVAPQNTQAEGAKFQDTWRIRPDEQQEWEEQLARDEPAILDLLKVAGVNSGQTMRTYLAMLGIRLVQAWIVLRPKGTIYLHCDPTASHYLKLLMDAVFGKTCFRNEIVWAYTQGGTSKRDFSAKHDILFRYSRSPKEWTFNRDAVRVPWSKNTAFDLVDPVDGRRYREIWGTGRRKKYRYYEDEGKVPPDWWSDIPQMAGRNNKSTGYPTQKPEALLERIIAASSNPGDRVFDPFAGSGTTCLVAERLGREWAGIDCSEQAALVCAGRISELPDAPTIYLKKGVPLDAFDVAG